MAFLSREGCDEDIEAQRNSQKPIQVPVGPVTRSRAKRFKEELNNFVRRVLQENDSVFTAVGEQKMVLLIKFDPEENQDWYGRFLSSKADMDVFPYKESSQDYVFKFQEIQDLISL